MKRMPFAVMEGEELPDGRILEVGALYVVSEDSDRLAVTWAHDGHTINPIGWAHGFERRKHDHHADLSMVLVMNDPNHDDVLEHFWVYPFVTDVEEEVWETMPRIVKRVYRARIRTLQLVPIPGIPVGMAANIPRG